MKNKEINKEIERVLREEGNLTGKVTMMTLFPIRYLWKEIFRKC